MVGEWDGLKKIRGNVAGRPHGHRFLMAAAPGRFVVGAAGIEAKSASGGWWPVEITRVHADGSTKLA